MVLWFRHRKRWLLRFCWLKAFFGPVTGVLAKVKANLWLIGGLFLRILVSIGFIAGVFCSFFQREAALTRLAGCIQQGKAARWLFATFDSNLHWGFHWFAACLGWEAHAFTREDLMRFAWLDAIEKCLQVRTTQGFLFQQGFCQGIQVVTVLGQNVIGLLVRRVQKIGDLAINLRRNSIGVFQHSAAAHVGHGVALFLTVFHGAQFGAKAVFGNHGASNLGGLLNIRRCTCSWRAEYELFGSAAAHGEDKTREKFIAGVHALVVFLRGHGMTTSATTGQDGHLVDALNILQCPRRQGMSALVVGSDLLFLLRNHLGLTAWSTHDAVGGFFQCVSGNDIAANTRGQQRCLIQYVCKVSTGHTGGTLGQLSDVNVFRQRLVL